jgi:hypothetical protein
MSTFTRNLWLTSPMMRGGDVVGVQRQLTYAKGLQLATDGLFGRETADAVRDFQRKSQLSVDGVVGRMTWGALFNEPAPQPDRFVKDILVPDQIKALTTAHRRFVAGSGGVQWRLAENGLVLDDAPGPAFTPGDEKAVDLVMTKFASIIYATVTKVQVPIELVVACICVESSGDPNAIRHEPGCSLVNPELTPSKVSGGLMQTLLSTARDVLQRETIQIQDLLDPALSIEAGATYMWRHGPLTGFDPPVVGAAYNAGGIYFDSSPANRWRMTQYPIHQSQYDDRFVSFFNVAMGAKDGLKALYDQIDQIDPSRIPSFRQLLSP